MKKGRLLFLIVALAAFLSAAFAFSAYALSEDEVTELPRELAEYGSEGAESGEKLYYTLKKSDGTVIEYYNEVSFNDIYADADKGSFVTLYADLTVSAEISVEKKLDINLNGYSFSNGGFRIRLWGSAKTLYFHDGHLIDADYLSGTTVKSNDFVFIPADAKPTLKIENCTAEVGARFCDARGGTVETINSTFTQTKSNGAMFLLGSQGAGAKFTADNCTFNLKGGNLVSATRGNYTSAVANTATINNCVASTTAALFSLSNEKSAELSSNRISITGDKTELTFGTLEGGTCTVADTVFSFGTGVKLSAIPTTAVGSIAFIDGATSFKESEEGEAFPYYVTDEKLYYTITKSDGTVLSYYSEMSTNDLFAACDKGSVIDLYADLSAAAEVRFSKSITIRLNGWTISNATFRQRLQSGAHLKIEGGKVLDTSGDFMYIGDNTDTVLEFVDCEISINGKLGDTRNGEVIFKDSSISFSSGANSVFAVGSAGTYASVVFDNVTASLGSGTLASITRGSGYTSAANNELTIRNCDIESSGRLISLTNSYSADISTNRILIEGDKTRIVCESLDGDTCNVPDTVVTLGLGVKMSCSPTLKTGSFEFKDGAKGITMTDDAECPYLVSDKVNIPVKVYFALTLYSDFTLNICFKEEDLGVIRKITCGGVELTPVISDGMALYPITDIAAYNAADAKSISITYMNGGASFPALIEYSIIDYANGLLASTYSTESKEMICRAVDYIKSAYEYAGLEVPASVTAVIEGDAYKAISAEENAISIPASETNKGNLNTVIASAQLDLGSELRFRFNLQSGVTDTLTVTSRSVNEVFVIEDGLCDGLPYIMVKMRAFDMYDGIVKIESDTVSGTYDFRAYANSDAISMDETGMLDEVLLSLYNYCREANEYAKVSYKDFSPTASVVVKDGKDGTVTFVVDDGRQPTATWLNSYAETYPAIKLTFAISASNFAQLDTVYNEDTGKYAYALNADGKYTYTLNEDVIAYWRNLLENANGDYELISHTLTHSYWGIDDNGGIFTYVDNDGKIKNSKDLPEGSVTAEIYASVQIFNDIFGFESSTIVLPGVGAPHQAVTVDGVTYESCYPYFKEVLRRAYDEGLIVGMRGNGFGAAKVSKSYVITPEKFTTADARLDINALTTKGNQEVSDWLRYIDLASEDGGWAVFCIHYVVPDGDPIIDFQITQSQATTLFDYTKSKNVWVANFTEATKYYSEWSTAEVSAVCENGVIKVTLTDNERDDVYDVALTVKVSVPNAWKSCIVNGGEVIDVMVDESGASYVYVDIVPDSGVVTLTEG